MVLNSTKRLEVRFQSTWNTQSSFQKPVTKLVRDHTRTFSLQRYPHCFSDLILYSFTNFLLHGAINSKTNASVCHCLLTSWGKLRVCWRFSVRFEFVCSAAINFHGLPREQEPNVSVEVDLSRFRTLEPEKTWTDILCITCMHTNLKKINFKYWWIICGTLRS